MMLEMHLLKEIPDLCKRCGISHHISVRDATSPGFAYPYEKQYFSILA
jgi:hypothetical protein